MTSSPQYANVGQVVKETADYVVRVGMRLVMTLNDKPFPVYQIINKGTGVVEIQAGNLPAALESVDALQDALDVATGKKSRTLQPQASMSDMLESMLSQNN